MKQSTRLRMRKEYLEHPLRQQYENEKKNISTKSPIKHLLNLILAIPIILIFVIGFCFFSDAWFDNPIIENTFTTLFLGIINLIACGIVFSWVEEQKKKLNEESDEFKELKEKYEQKGLYEITEEELLNGKCAELDSDDDWVCSVTGEWLSSSEARWCLVSGNCRHCRKFVEAYLGTTEYWPYEIKR